MKIAFLYPPIFKDGRSPNLSQNRQFIYTKSGEIRIFPVILGSAATMLKNDGHKILWLDGINERLNRKKFDQKLKKFNPDLIILETKAPLVRLHWQFINELKVSTRGGSAFGRKNEKLKVILIGDHVSYFPEESLRNSKVDFVITGGDYDFSIRDLVRSLVINSNLPKGICYKNKGKIFNTGSFELIKNLDEAPIIDRDLTKWKIYGEAYLYHPCAYMMFGRGCGGQKGVGACTFCIWQHSFWKCSARLMSPRRVVNEIKHLVNKYKVKEIFDDTDGGPCYDKNWLIEFSDLMKKEGLTKKVRVSTNSRADVLDKATCRLLKEGGFRLLKIGLESGSCQTLKRINKKETLGQIIKGIQNAKDTGLRVLLTVMVGYPWESEGDVRKTYKVAKSLMLYKTKAGDSLQASILVPYPGTPLWKEATRNNWFLIDRKEYQKYDMSKPVLKSSIDPGFWCQKIWNIHKNPFFVLKSGVSIRRAEDIKLLLRGTKSLLGHTKDY